MAPSADATDTAAASASGRGTETYQTQHDWTGSEPVSHSVIEAVSEATGTDVERLAPLYEAIDPDALDALFESIPSRERMRGSVSFAFDGCSVRVAANGRILVRVLEGGSDG